MRGYPQFSFWISITPDMIYLSHIVIIWKKILPISGHRPYKGDIIIIIIKLLLLLLLLLKGLYYSPPRVPPCPSPAFGKVN